LKNIEYEFTIKRTGVYLFYTQYLTVQTEGKRSGKPTETDKEGN
jgi:hypothetical protein